MEKTVTCRDLGLECDFAASGLTGSETVTTIIRHVREKHTVDWFELEKIHARLRSLLRGIANAGGGRHGDA